MVVDSFTGWIRCSAKVIDEIVVDSFTAHQVQWVHYDEKGLLNKLPPINQKPPFKHRADATYRKILCLPN